MFNSQRTVRCVRISCAGMLQCSLSVVLLDYICQSICGPGLDSALLQLTVGFRQTFAARHDVVRSAHPQSHRQRWLTAVSASLYMPHPDTAGHRSCTEEEAGETAQGFHCALVA